jgi:hypothetical protein
MKTHKLLLGVKSKNFPVRKKDHLEKTNNFSQSTLKASRSPQRNISFQNENNKKKKG